jgi:hypothetical protein
MPRVSTYFGLGRTQATLEFVDVEVDSDVPLFIDPGAIRLLNTSLASECSSLVQSFFQRVLDAMQSGNHKQAMELLSTLNEKNETRLGFSSGGAHGHGMGSGLAEALHSRLLHSRAVTTGLLQDLEETALFVPGIDRDIISDIVTNIIFGSLVTFTSDMCTKYGIPTTSGVAFYRWDRRNGWTQATGQLPVIKGKALVLVPRAFVRRRRNIFDAHGYYSLYVLPYLQQQHLDANTELVRVLKSGEVRPPTKRALKDRHPGVKQTNVEFTEENPDLLNDYRRDAAEAFNPIGQSELAGGSESDEVDFDFLLQEVTSCSAGAADASKYQRAVEQLLTALFYPALDNPKLEQHLNSGRKRIDIDYENQATYGFFHWMHDVNKVHCSYVPVECKNYTEDPKNPELDQLLGRFSTQRGKFGILCYRTSDNKDLVNQRCRDAIHAGQGYILALDDEDLAALVKERKLLPDGQEFIFLRERFRNLVS